MLSLKMRELEITRFIQLIVYKLLGKNITVLGSRQVFDERILYQDLFTHGFHFGVMKRSQNLILHQILDIYPQVIFINKWLSTVQKCMFDVMH